VVKGTVAEFESRLIRFQICIRLSFSGGYLELSGIHAGGSEHAIAVAVAINT